MILHAEQNTCNSIDLIDENGTMIALVHGRNEGDNDITDRESNIADVLCEGFNLLPESESI